jgi:hypothetical protein
MFRTPPERAKTEKMSTQFVYLQFNVTPKGSLSRGSGSGTIAIELPSKHVTDWKLERPGRRSSDEEIAIDLAQVVAIAAAQKFVTFNSSSSHGAGDPLEQIHVGTPSFDE